MADDDDEGIMFVLTTGGTFSFEMGEVVYRELHEIIRGGRAVYECYARSGPGWHFDAGDERMPLVALNTAHIIAFWIEDSHDDSGK